MWQFRGYLSTDGWEVEGWRVCTANLDSVVTASVLVHLDVAARGVLSKLVFDLTRKAEKRERNRVALGSASMLAVM